MIELIQHAKFFAGAGGLHGHGNLDIVQPAILNVNGIKLMTETPKSAADALHFNKNVDVLIAVSPKPTT